MGLGWRSALKEAVARHDIDVVNVHAPVPGVAGVATTVAGRRALVLTYHVAPMLSAGRLLRDSAMRIYEAAVLPRLAARADQVICGSQYVLDGFAPIFAGKATVIRPGVDLNRFRPTEPAEARRLVFVGSLGAAAGYKGLADLLHALPSLAARYPQLHLDVVGDGDGRPGFEQLVEKLGIGQQQHLRGPLYGAELTRAYSTAVALVLPTLYDSLPTVVIEAMACHRTVVSTTVGGVPELVEHGVTGWLGPPGDRQALVANIAAVLDDPERAVTMGAEAGARVAKRLDWDVQTRRTRDVFQRAIERRRQPPRKVAVVSPYFAPAIGGVEGYVEGVARAISAAPDLRPRGLHQRLAAPQPPNGERPGRTARRAARPRAQDLQHAGQLALGFPAGPALPASGRHRGRVGRRRRFPLPGRSGHCPRGTATDGADLPQRLDGEAQGTAPDAIIRRYERSILPAVAGRASVLVSVSPTTSLTGHPRAITIAPSVDSRPVQPGRARARARRAGAHPALRRADGALVELEGRRRPGAGGRPGRGPSSARPAGTRRRRRRPGRPADPGRRARHRQPRHLVEPSSGPS